MIGGCLEAICETCEDRTLHRVRATDKLHEGYTVFMNYCLTCGTIHEVI